MHHVRAWSRGRIRCPSTVPPDEPIVPEPEEQTCGFLVLMTGSTAALEFEWSLRCRASEAEARSVLAELRAALPEVDPTTYLGFDREPIGRAIDGLKLVDLPATDPRVLGRFVEEFGRSPPGLPADVHSAERHIRERLGPDPTMYWAVHFVDSDLLPTLVLAREVKSLVVHSEDYEIVRVERGSEARHASTLGFDVGTWGSDHFSIVRDAMLAPRWHPAPEEDFASLREHAARLGDHALFETAAAARAFRDWYRSRPWAETEFFPGEIDLIRVDRAE